jgi:hypothetical protein
MIVTSPSRIPSPRQPDSERRCTLHSASKPQAAWPQAGPWKSTCEAALKVPVSSISIRKEICTNYI